MADDGNNQTLLRQLVSDIAEMRADARHRDKSIEAIGADAREARDGVREMATMLHEQDWGARVTELKAELKALEIQSRADLVNASTKTNEKIKGLEDRVELLEGLRHQAKGIGAALKAVRNYGGWVLSAFALAVAWLKGGAP